MASDGGVALAKALAARNKNPRSMKFHELDEFADNYEKNYGTDSTQDRPGFMRIFDSPKKRVFLGERGGKQFFRPTGAVSNAFTPELPEVAQQMAFVLAERKRRGMK